MATPLVTVIVPVYNAQNNINCCLKSICEQTYKELEIIVLNDGSKDRTLELCQEFAAKDERVVVVDKPNSGVSDTRNKGLALAHGKYIQFVDSDDYLASDFTEKMVDAAETHSAEMVISPFWMVFPEGYVDRPDLTEKLISKIHPRNSSGTLAFGFLSEGVYTLEEFLTQLIKLPSTFYYSVLWNKLYRRDIIEAHNIRFADENFAEDKRFNLQYLHYVNNVAAIETPGYYYIQNIQSVCHTSLSWKELWACRMKMLHHHKELYVYTGLYRTLWFKVFMTLFGENEITLPPLYKKELSS